MTQQHSSDMISLEINDQFWNRFFTVHGLFLVGSKEPDGGYNLAPKHMGMPMGFSPYFGFIGTPRKATYRNITSHGYFTVSFPHPNQLVSTTLTASQREPDNSKPIIESLPTVNAECIEGVVLQNSYLQLECKLHEISGHYGEWEMIVGQIVHAYVDQRCLRKQSVDDNDLIHQTPLLAYLHPDRHAKISESLSIPLPQNFKR
jgi:flavin reductase (DIM6/NTAB) family NADH-FMN oxidoreductase RutF